MSISFGGMASGLDTNGIIDQLMQIESQPQVRLAQRQRITQAHQDLMKQIGTKLQSVRTALTNLQSVSTWANTQTITSSDTTKLTPILTAGAAPGAYQVNVTQLARSEQRTYNYTAPTSPNKKITIGTYNLTLTQGETIDQTIAAINNDSTAPVTAVNVGGQMVLTSKTTGTAGAFTATSNGGMITEDTTKARVGQNATGTVDGVAFSSSSNTVTNAIVGVTLNLSSTTTSAVTVNVGTPGIDKNAVTKAAQSFVDAYNSALTFIQGKLDEKKDPKATTDAGKMQGLVFGDSMLSSALSQLREAVSDPLAGSAAGFDQLSDIGISTGATTGSGTINQSNVDGLLTLDSAKLSTALDTNTTAVKRLLQGDSTTTGISGRIGSLLDAYAGTGGLIDGRVDSDGRQLTDMTSQMSDLTTRLALKKAHLQAQFTAMETALSQSQSQGQWLNGQISSLPSGH